ncbi:MAG: hypothetical protein A6F71_03365 [Cycloclasticus sp. symbiont of Poecilosclerida sp. M]|nr:MAG: hypothetical protein A6F71_03365 [Cycloclasticus sp. symbiont of Poecilosclerida sp. M]
MIPVAFSLHVLSAAIWVGGMFFAYMVLRPIAAMQLEPPERLALWSNVFSKFFPWVWACVVMLLGTGFWLVYNKFGGFELVAGHIHIMTSVGIIMTLIFIYVFFWPARRLSAAVEQADWSNAAHFLAQARLLIGVNLLLGLSIIAVASGGRYLFS